MRTLATRSARSLLLVAALGLSTQACTDDPAAPVASTIPIGGLFSLTGNWSSLGTASKVAMEIGIADANALAAQRGSPLRFSAVIRDTRLDPTTVQADLTTLAAAGVEVVVGPQSSAEVTAVKSYADATGLLIVSHGSTAGSLAIPDDNVLRFTPSDTLEGVALAGLMRDDGVTHAVPLWRLDAGNVGLQVAIRSSFGAVGNVSAGVQYSGLDTQYGATLAALRLQVDQAIASAGSAERVAVAHAGFDEAADIFGAAAADAVLSSVRWYGTDGMVLSEAIRGNAAAAAFAQRVRLWAPAPGLEEAARASRQAVASRIEAITGVEPDAFTLAVYDAVLVAARAYETVGGTGSRSALKTEFLRLTDDWEGTSGALRLNAAGDRAFGVFDFFAITPGPAGPQWTRRAQFDTRSRALVRFP
jgi:branched-chain amino acid transport system substrate-binding protein